MRIGIAGPLATADLVHLLSTDPASLPAQMQGSSVLVTLIEALLAKGHEVVAYTTDPSLAPRPGSHAIGHGPGLTVHYVPRRRHALRGDRGARGRMVDLFRLERQELARAMRLDPPDVLHAHWSYEFAAAALSTGLPCLVTCHDSPLAVLRASTDLYRVGRLLMAWWVLRRIRHATVVSPYLVTELRSLLACKPAIVPNPMPDWILEMAENRRLQNPDPGKFKIVMVLNGWTRIKNPEVGIRAAHAFLQEHPGAELHLVGPDYGPGQTAEQWCQTLPEPGRSAIHFHGSLPHRAVIELLTSMDVLVHPSVEESFGLTVAEGMSLGIPVVCGRDTGALDWMTDGGQAGILTDVTSDAAILDALRSLQANGELYRELSTRGRQLANQRFSASAIADQYLQAYEAVLS